MNVIVCSDGKRNKINKKEKFKKRGIGKKKATLMVYNC